MWCCTQTQESPSPLQDVHEESYDFRLGDTSEFRTGPTGVCAMKVGASCGAKLGVRVNVLNQECASKKAEILTSYNVCWDEQMVKLILVSKFPAVSSPPEPFAILIWMFGNAVEIVNVLGTSQFIQCFLRRAGALCVESLMWSPVQVAECQ
jgi:hypothetical protein